MKNCDNCRYLLPDDIGQCPECGRMFSATSTDISVASWQSGVLAQAQREAANENAVRRGSNNVSVHPQFMANIKASLKEVEEPDGT